MTLRTRFGINTSKFFIVLLLSFLTIQLISWLLTEFMGYKLLKMGWMLLLFLVIIGIVTLFVLGKNITQLTLKREGLFILLVFGLIVLAFIYLPKYIPQIFSTSGYEIREFLRETIGGVIELGPRGITG